MKKIIAVLFAISLLLTACKKDSVDATSTQAFRESLNDMASRLNTIQQIKFNEALYILKTFGVNAEGEANEMSALRTMLSGKKVPEILALADQVASQNTIAWSSTGPPSLGEMNIFDDAKATEHDPNEIDADGLEIVVNPISVDEILGAKALQVIPKLVDDMDKPIVFDGAALETIMEVYSNGTRLSTSKNLMLDNKFTGFTIRYPNLPSEKISDNKIDITVSVKTSKKTYKMTKVGVPVNPKALRQPTVAVPDDPMTTTDDLNTGDVDFNQDLPPIKQDVPKAAGDPRVTVQRFLNNLSSQNLKGAYDVSSNPSWGSYENFSNPNSGFGGVKSLNVKSISSKNVTENSANVNATYDVMGKDGKVTALQVTFGLKNVDGEWKISSYSIN